MEAPDLLYSGLMVTAFMLSVWTGALLAAACVFFAPAFFASRAPKASNSKS
jgi:hypothetical protein